MNALNRCAYLPEFFFDTLIATVYVIYPVNERIAAGQLKNRGGEAVTEKIDGGLLREDGKFLYPIRESIPIMLIDEALPFED